MSKFLAYLRNDKGGAVEYVLVTAGIGAAIVAATTNSTVRTGFVNMITGLTGDATTAAGRIIP